MPDKHDVKAIADTLTSLGAEWTPVPDRPTQPIANAHAAIVMAQAAQMRRSAVARHSNGDSLSFTYQADGDCFWKEHDQRTVRVIPLIQSTCPHWFDGEAPTGAIQLEEKDGVIRLTNLGLSLQDRIVQDGEVMHAVIASEIRAAAITNRFLKRRTVAFVERPVFAPSSSDDRAAPGAVAAAHSTPTLDLIEAKVRELHKANGGKRVKKIVIADALGYTTPDSLNNLLAQLCRLGRLESVQGRQGGYLPKSS